MPTRRMIDPRLWQSETLAALTLGQRLLFIGLFSNADDQGRLRAHPALIRSLVFPYDDMPLDQVEADLQAIADAECIQLYETEGRRCLQVINWWHYQKPQWAYPSQIPPPEGWQDKLRYRQDKQILQENWPERVTKPSPKSLSKSLAKALPEGEAKDMAEELAGVIGLGLELGLAVSNSVEKNPSAPNVAPPLSENPQEPESKPPTPKIPTTAVLSFYLESFGRKRFGTIEQKRALWEAEKEYGSACVKEAIRWAARNNIRNTDSIITAARKKAKREKEKIRAPPPLPPVEDERTDEEKRLDDIWDRALDELCSGSLGKTAVNTYLHDSYLVAQTPGRVLIVVRDELSSWLETDGWQRQIRQALGMNPDATIAFEVETEAE